MRRAASSAGCIESIAAAIGLEGAERTGRAVITLYGLSLSVLRPRLHRPWQRRDPVRNGRDRSRRRPAWLYEMNPVEKVPVSRRGRVDPARVGRDQRVPEREVSRAAPWPDDPGERRRWGCLPLRRFLEAVHWLFAGTSRARAAASRKSSATSTVCSAGRRAERARLRSRGRGFLPWLLRARDLLDIALDPRPALADWVESASWSLGRGRRSCVVAGCDRRLPPRLPARRAHVGVGRSCLYALGRTMDEWADAVLMSIGPARSSSAPRWADMRRLAAARRAPERLAGVCSGLPAGSGHARALRQRAETIATGASAAPRGLGGRTTSPKTVTRKSLPGRELALDVPKGAGCRARGDSRPAGLHAAYRALGDRARSGDSAIVIRSSRRGLPGA